MAPSAASRPAGGCGDEDQVGRVGAHPRRTALEDKWISSSRVTQLEKQLPGKADMEALLSDINQAGIGRGLQFELLRPGIVEVKDYYAELPIALRVTGRFHDLGLFAADVANLSRIVTLHSPVLAAPGKDVVGSTAIALPAGMLVLDATARTYRYLSPVELGDNLKAKAAAAKAAKK